MPYSCSKNCNIGSGASKGFARTTPSAVPTSLTSPPLSCPSPSRRASASSGCSFHSSFRLLLFLLFPSWTFLSLHPRLNSKANRHDLCCSRILGLLRLWTAILLTLLPFPPPWHVFGLLGSERRRRRCEVRACVFPNTSPPPNGHPGPLVELPEIWQPRSLPPGLVGPVVACPKWLQWDKVLCRLDCWAPCHSPSREGDSRKRLSFLLIPRALLYRILEVPPDSPLSGSGGVVAHCPDDAPTSSSGAASTRSRCFLSRTRNL